MKKSVGLHNLTNVEKKYTCVVGHKTNYCIDLYSKKKRNHYDYHISFLYLSDIVSKKQCEEKIKIKSLRHSVFPGGHPSKY